MKPPAPRCPAPRCPAPARAFDRRRLLLGASAAGALLAACRAGAGSPEVADAEPREDEGAAAGGEPWFRISLAEWSLHRTIRSGELEHLELAATARELGLEAVEYVSQFFQDRPRDAAYLADMRARADDAGVASLLVMVDGAGALATSDDAARRRAVEAHVPWLEAAAALGCHSIRVNAHGDGPADERAARAADSLVRLAERAAPHDLSVLVENHGGLSSDGSWLADVMRRAAHPRVGTLPDFGNFDLGDGVRYDRYRGVAELLPFAKAVSAKSHDFDGDGNEVHTDYRRMLRLVRDAGYRGWIGIEYEGASLPEREGILATKRLLERVRVELA